MKPVGKIVLVIVLLNVLASADTMISLGTAANYAVLGLQNTSINNSLGTLNGNEGISKGGKIANQAPFTVNGNVYEYAKGQFSGPGHLNGTVNINPTLLTQNVTDALNAFNAAKILTPTVPTLASLTTARTFTGDGGMNVIDITGNVSLNNANLTLTGTKSDFFVVNIGGNVSLVGTAMFKLGGGVTPDHVLYNLTKSGCTVSTNIGDAIYGTLLGPGCSFTLDGNFYGEIIGGGSSITLMSGAVVNQRSLTPPPTPPAVPEPATLVLFGSGLLGMAGTMRRRLGR